MADIPVPKEIMDQMMDHHDEQLSYHSKMLSKLKEISGSEAQDSAKPSSGSDTEGKAKSSNPDYARGGTSPLGGTAKPPQYFKAK